MCLRAVGCGTARQGDERRLDHKQTTALTKVSLMIALIMGTVGLLIGAVSPNPLYTLLVDFRTSTRGKHTVSQAQLLRSIELP